METIFHKTTNIFQHFLNGQDEVTLGKIASLADRFSSLSSLSSLDLPLDLERFVTQVAAQLASEFIGRGEPGLQSCQVKMGRQLPRPLPLQLRTQTRIRAAGSNLTPCTSPPSLPWSNRCWMP